SFLQGQITCDLESVSPSQSYYAAHCNAKGRVQAFFRVIQLDEQTYLLSLPNVMLNSTLTKLKKYALFSKVKLQISEEWVQLGLSGVNAPELIKELFNLQDSALTKPNDC